MGARLVWVLASAGLLVAALPPHGFGGLGWVALVPLVIAVQGTWPSNPGVSPSKAAIFGAMFGAVSVAGMHSWLWRLPAFSVVDGLVIGVYLAMYPAAWCAALAWLRARRLPWVLPGALAWTLLQGLRARAGFLADPWDPLAYTQAHGSIVVQVASLGGEPLVGFVVCIGNLALAQAWLLRQPRRLLGPGALIVASCAYGLRPRFERADAGARDSLAVAVIQPGKSPPSAPLRIDNLRTLTLEAAAQHPDVIVWPESAVNAYSFDPSVQEVIGYIALETNVPIVFGSAEFGKYGEEALTSAEDLQLKNEAFLVGRDGALAATYTKNRLVPFAEWTPLSSRITWPRWLVARQLHGIAGDAPGLFVLDGGRRVGILICWENLFTDLSGRLDRGGASLILQLTNDSDFEGDAEPAQHNAASVLRAVEYGRPVLVASTTGPSLSIDARGRVQNSLDRGNAPTWMVSRVNTGGASTVYSWLGLKWLWLAVIVAVLATGVEIRARRPEP